MRALAAGVLLLSVAAAPADAQSDAAAAPERIRFFERWLEQSPGNCGVMYDLAVESARAGRAKEALGWLDRALAAGVDPPIESERAFDALRKSGDLAPLLDKARKNRNVLKGSSVAFRIPDRTLIPEGIAYDPKDDAFYVGSLHKNAIFRIERPGRVARFAPKGADSLWSVAGIEIDPQRRHLWAATAGGPAAGSTALVQYDLETGARLARFAAEPKRGEKRFFNDIAITAGGDVYVTDSDEGSVYRVTAKDRTLEPFAAAGQLVYPNGIALSSDGRALFVADAKAGLSRIEIATGKVEPLGRPAGVCLFGIDGLSRHGRSLIGVVNSAGAERIVRFRLDPSETSVVGSETLDARNPRFQIPTTGAVARDGYYFIANSHLDRLAEDGRIKAGSKLEEVLILRIALD